MKAILLLLLVLALTGCGLLDPLVCSGQIVFGIRIAVVDSISGTPIGGVDIQAIATDGEYADTVRRFGDDQGPALLGVVDDRPGTYSVETHATGYAPWVRNGVRVRMEDRCHVRAVDLTARLQR